MVDRQSGKGGGATATDFILIKGAREHNLCNLDLAIPRNALTVITGVSGSGKSSLAFDTLYAEGYRKYMDSLSTRARSVLEQLPRPDVDYIHGLSPVIAVEQRTAGGNHQRSTVASVTEIADFARVLWAVAGEAFCPEDGGRIRRNTLEDAIATIFEAPEGSRMILLAPWMEAKPSVLRGELPRLVQRGFQRVRVDGEIRRLDEPDVLPGGSKPVRIDIVIDRLVVSRDQERRLADSLELAFREGGDRALALLEDGEAPGGWRERVLSHTLACSICGTPHEALTPRHFSWNHPDGACPDCGGFGETLQFEPSWIVPDVTKSVRGGAVKPWRLGSKRMIIRRNAILKQLAEQLPFDPEGPWEALPESVRETILHGAGERLFSFKLTPGRGAPEVVPFAGVLADLEETKRTTSSEGLRARLSTYQFAKTCPTCEGKRLRKESLHVFVQGWSIADFLSRPLGEAAGFVARLRADDGFGAVGDAVAGLAERLRFLEEVGLGYLTLDRAYQSLSGGEAQRVRLATQLGMALVGVVYVLDEPSIGLHPVDNVRLLRTLEGLRDRGNTVVVVEHDAATMLAADHLIELGPGAGVQGGRLVFEGPPAAALNAPASISGPFLSGQRRIEREASRAGVNDSAQTFHAHSWLLVEGAGEHNLRDVSVRFPVGALSVICGISGSGKSTLVHDILARAAAHRLNGAKSLPGKHRAICGLEHFRSVVEIDQSPIGRSPRSNPATFTKVFDLLRDLFAKVSLAKVRGYDKSRFSFNISGGRCERCKGDGVIKLDMQFMADVYAECPSCHGRRYNRETLDIRFKGHTIADILGMDVDNAVSLFAKQPRIHEKLRLLQSVGLGYLKLGQAATTLSGGEAQRLKLALELSKRQQGDTLYILDEPTTGLHWIDIQRLVDILFQLRAAGNTILIIEHNLDVIGLADWIVELGPRGGSGGGLAVFEGEMISFLEATTATAQALKQDRQRWI